MSMKTKGKRLLAAVLTLVLLLSAVPVCLSVSAEETAEIGLQDYESYEATTYAVDGNGIHGNGSGREVSTEQNHTAGGSKSIKLNVNQSHLSYYARTVLPLDGADLQVWRGDHYIISFWLYSEVQREITWYVGSLVDATSPSSSDKNNEEQKGNVSLPAGVWTQVTADVNVVGPSSSNTAYLTIGALFDGCVSNPGYIYLDDVLVKEEVTLTQNYDSLAVGTELGLKTPANAVVSSDVVRGSEGRSLKLTMTSTAGNGREQFALLNSQGKPMQVEIGKRYTVTMWVNIRGGNVNVNLNYWLCSSSTAAALSNKNTAEYDLVAESVSTPVYEWVEVTFTTAPIANGPYLIFGITTFDASATNPRTAYIDDVSVTEYVVEEEVTLTQNYESLAEGTELGLKTPTNAVVSSEVAHPSGSGGRSLKVAMSSSAGTGREQFALLNSKGEPMQVEIGKRYTVTMWVYIRGNGNIPLNYWLCSSATAAALTDKSTAEYDPGDVSTPGWTWVEVTFTTAPIANGPYLIFGLTTSDANGTSRTAFVDDVSVTEYVPASPVTTFNGGLLYTGGKVGSLNGETGSAVYTVGDTQYTAMRVAADYTCVDNDPTKVAYDGGTWTVVGRGVLLNYSYTAGEGGTPTVDDTASYLKKNYITGDALYNYWSLEDNTLRYSVLVKNLNQEKATGLYLTYRSYMVITDGTNEVTVYGDTVSDVTVQKLYEAATSQGASVKWFDE